MVLLDSVDSIALSIMAVIDINKQNGAVSKPGTDTVTTVLIVGAGELTFLVDTRSGNSF